MATSLEVVEIKPAQWSHELFTKLTKIVDEPGFTKMTIKEKNKLSEKLVAKELKKVIKNEREKCARWAEDMAQNYSPPNTDYDAGFITGLIQAAQRIRAFNK